MDDARRESAAVRAEVAVQRLHLRRVRRVVGVPPVRLAEGVATEVVLPPAGALRRTPLAHELVLAVDRSAGPRGPREAGLAQEEPLEGPQRVRLGHGALQAAAAARARAAPAAEEVVLRPGGRREREHLPDVVAVRVLRGDDEREPEVPVAGHGEGARAAVHRGHALVHGRREGGRGRRGHALQAGLARRRRPARGGGRRLGRRAALRLALDALRPPHRRGRRRLRGRRRGGVRGLRLALQPAAAADRGRRGGLLVRHRRRRAGLRLGARGARRSRRAADHGGKAERLCGGLPRRALRRLPRRLAARGDSGELRPQSTAGTLGSTARTPASTCDSGRAEPSSPAAQVARDRFAGSTGPRPHPVLAANGRAARADKRRHKCRRAVSRRGRPTAPPENLRIRGSEL